MDKRSSIALGVAAKHFGRMVRYPWIGSKLIKLQLEKKFFNQWHPHYKQGRAGQIRQLSIRITDICNLRCGTCGQWGPRGFLHGTDLKVLKKSEVQPGRYLDLFADLVAQGHHPTVYFWGGEPMLYDGILDLIEGATALRLPTSIATNSTRIAESADRLVRAPLFLLQMSIDGPNAELHNRLRPSAGQGDNFASIQEALAAVQDARRIHKTDLPLIASLSVVQKANYRYLLDHYEAFRDKVDLFVYYLSWWIDADSAQAHEKDFEHRFGFPAKKHWGWVGDWAMDDYAELNRQLQGLIAVSRHRKNPPVTIIPHILGEDNLRTYYTDHQARFGFNQCISIFQAVEINSNGDLSPCRDYHDFVVGNVKEQSISQLWNSQPYVDFRKSLSNEGLMPVCSRCCGLMGY